MQDPHRVILYPRSNPAFSGSPDSTATACCVPFPPPWHPSNAWPVQIPALALQPAARPALSPRLMEASTWALARWCDTYLLPEEPLPGSLQVRGVGAACRGEGGLQDA